MPLTVLPLLLLPHRRRRSDERRIDAAAMISVRTGFLFILIIIFSTFLQTRSEIITLTSETFSDKVKEKDTVWFVKFCVPWCKHCKNMGMLWEDLANDMEGDDEIEVGEVDCTTAKPVCNKVDIHTYPTFMVFYDGEEFAKYKGPKTVESLRSFVLEEAQKAARSKIDDDRDEF